METARGERIKQWEHKLVVAVEYAGRLRASNDANEVESCEKAIRYANMLSGAIIALKTGKD